MRDISERILEDFRACEVDHLIGEPIRIDERNFLHDLQDMFFGIRVVVSPTVSLPSGAVPANYREIPRGIFLLKGGRSQTEPAPLGLEQKRTHQNDDDEQREFARSDHAALPCSGGNLRALSRAGTSARLQRRIFGLNEACPACIPNGPSTR